MRRALGFQEVIVDGQVQAIHETFTCGHCNGIVRMPKATPLREAQNAIRDVRRCFGCDMLVCPVCARKPVCTPFEKRLEAIERSAKLALGG